ncbi:MAG: hypothetical protein PUK18_08985, partial [Firmicutes bacterium]|nr:hypothetical protein [Bacillota bacterium]MDY6159547.1 hypothetical protein [Candidatus Faecousia sp.]
MNTFPTKHLCKYQFICLPNKAKSTWRKNAVVRRQKTLEFRYIEPPKLSTGQEPTKQQKTKQKRKKFAPFCDIIESPQNNKPNK